MNLVMSMTHLVSKHARLKMVAKRWDTFQKKYQEQRNFCLIVELLSLKLSSDQYRRSPLFQGGLEIPCIVAVTMAGTVRNHMVLDQYNRLYCEPKNEVIIGCFLAKNKDADTVALDNEVTVPKKKKKKTPKRHESIPKSRDIRQLFFMQNRKNMETSTVVID